MEITGSHHRSCHFCVWKGTYQTKCSNVWVYNTVSTQTRNINHVKAFCYCRFFRYKIKSVFKIPDRACACVALCMLSRKQRKSHDQNISSRRPKTQPCFLEAMYFQQERRAANLVKVWLNFDPLPPRNLYGLDLNHT